MKKRLANTVKITYLLKGTGAARYAMRNGTMINSIRKMFEDHEFHVVVEKGKIWLYFWKECAGSKKLEKLPFDCWGKAWRFVKDATS